MDRLKNGVLIRLQHPAHHIFVSSNHFSFPSAIIVGGTICRINLNFAPFYSCASASCGKGLMDRESMRSVMHHAACCCISPGEPLFVAGLFLEDFVVEEHEYPVQYEISANRRSVTVFH